MCIEIHIASWKNKRKNSQWWAKPINYLPLSHLPVLSCYPAARKRDIGLQEMIMQLMSTLIQSWWKGSLEKKRWRKEVLRKKVKKIYIYNSPWLWKPSQSSVCFCFVVHVTTAYVYKKKICLISVIASDVLLIFCSE